MNQRKDFLIKLNLMKLNFFMFLILFFFSCQEDNYKECADLSYGTDYIQITGVSEYFNWKMSLDYMSLVLSFVFSSRFFWAAFLKT